MEAIAEAKNSKKLFVVVVQDEKDENLDLLWGDPIVSGNNWISNIKIWFEFLFLFAFVDLCLDFGFNL